MAAREGWGRCTPSCGHTVAAEAAKPPPLLLLLLREGVPGTDSADPRCGTPADGSHRCPPTACPHLLSPHRSWYLGTLPVPAAPVCCCVMCITPTSRCAQPRSTPGPLCKGRSHSQLPVRCAPPSPGPSGRQTVKGPLFKVRHHPSAPGDTDVRLPPGPVPRSPQSGSGSPRKSHPTPLTPDSPRAVVRG